MRENEKDTSTRRFSTDGFDCQPPREAVDELLRPKRPRMFHPPEPPHKRSRFEEIRTVGNTIVLWAIGIAFIIALFSIASRVPKPAPVAPAVIVQPTPAPPLTPVVPQPEVRRAQLAVKRAQFVGLPIGWQGQEQMPDGSVVSIRYMGEVGYFDSLPRNPALGDMWKVTSSGASWVWTTPAGFAAPAWVDP
jgi:hypothetical protein